MARTVEVRIADMPSFQALLGAVADLVRALGKCENLPQPVMAAADQVRREIAVLGHGGQRQREGARVSSKVIIEAYTYASNDPEDTLELTVGDTFEDRSDQWSWFKIVAIPGDD